MAEKEEETSSGVDNSTSRGTDWEVVSLTASAYAASPGPNKPVDSLTPPSEPETSHPLYMSRHFVLPPSEDHHHNIEPSEIYEDNAIKKIDSEQETPRKEAKDELEFAGLDFFQEEEKGIRDDNNIYDSSLLQDERAFGGSHVYEHNVTPDVSPELDPSKEDDEKHQVPPCEAWWKRSAASLVSQAKETNTIWSIFIAAAVMGVVVLGQRWQHERWQLLQLKWDSTIANEKAGRLMGPISRLKQAFVGGQRRDSFIRVSSQNDS